MTDDRTLFDLQREASELRVRLAFLEANIRRREHDLWRQHQADRDAALKALDSAAASLAKEE